MQISVELSLYALKDDYKEIVEGFLLQIADEFGIKTYYTPMSTTIIGDYEVIMELLDRNIKPIFEENKAVFNIKISNACVNEFHEIEEN